jgi:hypothetical protein
LAFDFAFVAGAFAVGLFVPGDAGGPDALA